MSPRCYRTQRYTIKKNNIKRTQHFFVFWSIFAPMKILYTIVGTTSLILGIIGIFLPLLPTTPFLLLTAAMYFRSSPRLYYWLIQQKYLGSYIRNFREHKAITFTCQDRFRIINMDYPKLLRHLDTTLHLGKNPVPDYCNQYHLAHSIL